MKVTGVNNIIFRGNSANVPSNSVVRKDNREIKELGYVTPDFNVKTPTRYTPTGVHKVMNELDMYTYKLANGYKVCIVPMEGSPSVVKTYVNVGSMNETPDIKGISHFLEHMAFNGTNGENGHMELKTGDSFKKIDELGGWANASTNYAITDYINSAPLLENKDLETQIKVIAAMAEDLKLSEEMIEKEKGPVSSEINMIMDDPDTIAMDQTVRTLFNVKSPADELVGGSVGHIQNLTRQKVMDYYNKYYTPDNTYIVITGDVNPEETISLVAKNFTSNKTSKGQKYEEKLTPIDKTVRKDFISDKATSANIVLGFCGPKSNNTRDNILFSICDRYLNSDSSGLYYGLKEYNTDFSTDSQKISTNLNNPRMTTLFLTTADKNAEKSLRTAFDIISNIKPIDKDGLELIKQKIKYQRENVIEYSDSINNFVGTSLLDNDMDYITKYDEILNSITPEEVNAAFKKFFNLNKAAITVVHPKEHNDNISFKGKRIPIDNSKVEFETSDNNYDVAFYKTKNKNINFNIDLNTDKPYIGKPAVSMVLNNILDKGTLGSTEKEFYDYLEKNNIDVNVTAGQFGLSVFAGGNSEKYKLALEKAKEVLYNPNITEENLKEAVKNIKDNMERKQDTAFSLYSDYAAQYLPYDYTDEEILNSLDSITIEDVKDLHKYLIENSSGIVTANLPNSNEDDVRTTVLDFVNELKTVKPNIYNFRQNYTPQKNAVVLTKANKNSQADISETFRFRANDDLKDTIAGSLMRSILSSSSIGLFDILREKENLAYSVYADISRDGDIGELSLNILTTTDNKEIGEYSYDNVQKSINGFNRQIEELLNGKFTDDDLENAKHSMKANLLDNEGNGAKLHSLSSGLKSKYGIEHKNQLFNEIDNITKDDIINFAKQVFSQKPIYSIVGSQDTLDANKEFLKQLEN